MLSGYLDGAMHTSGGVELASKPLHYGKAEIRYRVQPGAYGYSIVLWPTKRQSPPWVEVAKDMSADHSSFTTAVYGTDRQYHSQKVSVDSTQWHTLGVQWTPGLIVITIDGVEKTRISGTGMPDEPMFLVIDQLTRTCGGVACADTSSSSELQVDWVHLYNQAG